MKNIIESINTPWKAVNEILMYLFRIPVLIYLRWISFVDVKKESKFYGFPLVMRHKNSKILIGERFENRNWWFSNPLGINHPTIMCTWNKGAQIVIGNDVGISGGSIVASQKIEIGNGTIIGANTTIIDTDFHPLKSERRRYDKDNVQSQSIRIGNNVFIGMNCVILKGSDIPNNSIVPAGSVVRRNTKFQ